MNAAGDNTARPSRTWAAGQWLLPTVGGLYLAWKTVAAWGGTTLVTGALLPGA